MWIHVLRTGPEGPLRFNTSAVQKTWVGQRRRRKGQHYPVVLALSIEKRDALLTQQLLLEQDWLLPRRRGCDHSARKQESSCACRFLDAFVVVLG